jgi:hypothetical protein
LDIAAGLPVSDLSPSNAEAARVILVQRFYYANLDGPQISLFENHPLDISGLVNSQVIRS